LTSEVAPSNSCTYSGCGPVQIFLLWAERAQTTTSGGIGIALSAFPLTEAVIAGAGLHIGGIWDIMLIAPEAKSGASAIEGNGGPLRRMSVVRASHGLLADVGR